MSYPIITGPVLEGYAIGSTYGILSGMQFFIVTSLCNIVSTLLGIGVLFDMSNYISYIPAIIPFTFNYFRYDKDSKGEKIIKKVRKRNGEKKLIIIAIAFYVSSILIMMAQFYV
ncbi:MAG: hypothetical protein LBM06_08950 [Prevotellaceae bacterium]|jgi:hypothetical protein|nr:hypothetical protein [Prevotellaceae bacterium]